MLGASLRVSEMNGEKSYSSEWQGLLSEAEVENDPARLSAIVQSMEDLLFLQLGNGTGSEDHSGTRNPELQKSVSDLRRIQKLKLGYPDWE